jgi:phosphoglycolate phosphatase
MAADLDLTGTTIVFDLDGTLVDTAPDLAAATNHVLRHKGLQPVSLPEIHPLIGHGSKAMIEAGLRVHGARVEEPELNQLHEMFLEFYAANVAVGSRPFEHIPELIDTLKGQGAKLAVCTNKVEGLSRLLLSTLELDSHFAAIAGRDTFDVFKPDPGHLTQTIKAAGGDPNRAVMVGDSDTDITTARNAGIPCIAVTFGYTPIPVRELNPTIVIDHYREFMPALATVLRA